MTTINAVDGIVTMATNLTRDSRPSRSDRPTHGFDERAQGEAFEHRVAARGVEPEHAVAGVPAGAGLGDEPEHALHALTHPAQEVGTGRQAVVARVAQDEHQGAAAEHVALPLPQIGEDAAEVRAGMEI